MMKMLLAGISRTYPPAQILLHETPKRQRSQLDGCFFPTDF